MCPILENPSSAYVQQISMHHLLMQQNPYLRGQAAQGEALLSYLTDIIQANNRHFAKLLIDLQLEPQAQIETLKTQIAAEIPHFFEASEQQFSDLQAQMQTIAEKSQLPIEKRFFSALHTALAFSVELYALLVLPPLADFEEEMQQFLTDHLRDSIEAEGLDWKM